MYPPDVAYVITEPCVGVVDTICAEACPVDCIHPRPGEEGFGAARMLHIDPWACIDCSACTEVCPVEAPMLEADVPERWEPYTAINRAWYDQDPATAGRMLDEVLPG